MNHFFVSGIKTAKGVRSQLQEVARLYRRRLYFCFLFLLVEIIAFYLEVVVPQTGKRVGVYNVEQQFGVEPAKQIRAERTVYRIGYKEISFAFLFGERT